MRLRHALRANAVFSAVSGVAGLAAAEALVELLGSGEPWMVRVIAVGLLIFAAAVTAVSMRPPAHLGRGALLISIADIGWVVVSAVLIAVGLFSTAGTLVTGAVAVVVLEFALAQLWTRAAPA